MAEGIRRRRAALIAAGVLVGLLLLALLFWVALQVTPDRITRDLHERGLGLPPDAYEVEDVRIGGAARISLRDVALLDDRGNTVVSAPQVRFVYDPAAARPGVSAVISDVELISPEVRLVQEADGSWNIARVVRMEAMGEPVDVGDVVILQNVRVRDGRVTVATPFEAPEPGAVFALHTDAPRRVDGRLMDVRNISALSADIPEIRIGGEAGWQVDLASLSASIDDPDIRIAELSGVAGGTADGGVRFGLRRLRTDRSDIRGEGTTRLTAAGPQFDLRITAAPLDLADLAWAVPGLPEGIATFAADIRTVDAQRTAIALRDADVRVGDSRAFGRMTVTLGGPAGPVFRDTDLRLDPLELDLFERLGLVEDLPVTGSIRGSVVTVGEETVDDASLRVDLTADIAVPEAPAVAPSTIRAAGLIQVGAEGAPLRMDGVRVDLAPLRLAAFAPLVPEQAERMRGVLRGGALLTGTPSDLSIAAGEFTYEVGDAPPTRLADLTGRLRTEPELRYELSAVADPLALATLTEQFPALPFRRASLRGPISISGTGSALQMAADLQGEAGALDMEGELVFTDPLQFRVSADLEAFRPTLLVTTDLPVQAPLSGRVAAAGTTDDLTFDLDLSQPEGRAILAGRFRQVVGPPLVSVEGRLENFELGALVGRPQLFRDRMTGPIRVEGGGRQPYAMAVDLVGLESRLQVDGWFQPDDVPSYELAGEVRGIDLAELPWVADLPRTELAAAFEIEGEGGSPETFAGSFALVAEPSMVDGYLLEVAEVRGEVTDNVLRLDTLAVAYRDARIDASGAWALVEQEVADPIRFRVQAADLGAVAALIPLEGFTEMDLGGAFRAEGVLGGSLAAPEVAVGMAGQNLRYQRWRAQTLDATVVATLAPEGWFADVDLEADNVVLPGEERFEAVRLQVDMDPERTALGLFAQREVGTDLSLTAVADTDEVGLAGITLESLLLQLGDTRWQLMQPARIGWAEPGIEVDDLRLTRFGDVPGEIRVDGTIPTAGEADFLVAVTRVEMADIRAILPRAPDVEGLLDAEVRVTGPVESPTAEVVASIDGFGVGDARADRITLEALVADGQLAGTGGVHLNGVYVLDVQAVMPLELSLAGAVPSIELPEDGALDVRGVAAALPLELVAEVAPELREGEGYLSGEFNVAGTMGDPVMDGWVEIDAGAVFIEPLGTAYSDIRGRIVLENQQIEVEQLRIRSQGTAEIRGSIIVAEIDRPYFALTADFDEFRAVNLPDAQNVTLSGSVSLAGLAPTTVLRGSLVVDEGLITIPALAGDPGVMQLEDVDIGQVGADTIPEIVRAPGVPLVGDLRVDGLEVAVGENVRLTSDEVRMQLGGEVIVFREAEDLRLYGELTAERGTYTLNIGPISRDFDIERGRIQFTGTPELNPTLDFQAVHEVRNITSPGAGSTLRIFVEVTGTAQLPELALTSDSRPPLPESELFSFLIFGRPSFQLGTIAGGQLFEDILLQEVLGGLVATQIEQFLLRDLGLPLDYVRVHTRPTAITDPFGQTAIEAGVQLRPDLFLTTEIGVSRLFEGEGIPNFGASLEWQIDDYWSWRLGYEPLIRDQLRQFIQTPANQFTTDIRRRWEYGYPEETAAPQPLDLEVDEPIADDPTDDPAADPVPARPPPQ